MATVHVDQAAEKHIIERINERAGRLPDGLTAKAVLEIVTDTAAGQAPDDWRFTRHPCAHFFISMLLQPVEVNRWQKQVKFLGGTYRHTQRGAKLVRRLERLAECGTAPHAQARDTLTDIASRYLEDLADAEATVVHELKTVYKATTALGQEVAGHLEEYRGERHTGLLQALRAHRRLATRPNALVFRPAPEAAWELWVRQGEPYLAVDRKGAGRAPDETYAVFCRLTPAGIDPKQSALWAFDADGRALAAGQFASVATLAAPAACRPPAGYRTENYWTLPTALDRLAFDLDYECRYSLHRMTARRLALVTLLDQVYAAAWSLAEVPGASKPRWVDE